MKIKKQVSKLFIVALVLFSFASCEWDGSDDTHFVEVEKPAEEVADPWIELISDDGAIVNSQEEILMMNNSHVGFRIMPQTVKSYSKINYNVGNLTGYWDQLQITSGWSSDASFGYSINFDVPESAVKGELKLDLELTRTLQRTPSSLYDKTWRSYSMSNTYNVRVIKEADATVKNIVETVDKDGFLKLQWDKLDLNVEKIRVYKYNKQLVGEVADLAKPYIVDRDYIGGYEYYYIEVHLKNILGRRQITTEKSISHPVLSSEDVRVIEKGAKVKFAWDNPNPYSVKYILKLGDKLYRIPLGENSIEVDRTELGEVNLLHLYYLAVDRTDDDYLLSPDYVYFSFYL